MAFQRQVFWQSRWEVTHFFHENERYVPPSFAQTRGGLAVATPANANRAPPGLSACPSWT